MGIRRIFFLLPVLGALLSLLPAREAGAAPLNKRPGATLIVPYFEVDLDAPDGRTTLVSVGNVGEPVVAHATVWSDWGLPVYAWDLYLGQNGLATYNLRDLLVFGQVAPTGAPAGFGGCGNPVATPALAAADLLALQKQLTGRNLGNGLCASEPRADATLATGSLTIDTVEACASGSHFPTDPRYFWGDRPAASPRAVLWGDFTYVDPAENFAQGFEAFALGIAEHAEVSFGGWRGNQGIAREKLGEGCSRTRFLRGGPFAARTDLIVYTPPTDLAFADTCEPVAGSRYYRLNFRDEDGRLETEGAIWGTRRNSVRVEAGSELGVSLAAGMVELQTYLLSFFPGVPEPPQPLEHLFLGTIEASGRFAVGMAGVPLSRECR